MMRYQAKPMTLYEGLVMMRINEMNVNILMHSHDTLSHTRNGKINCI